MVTPFNHEASAKNFPAPKKIQVLGTEGIFTHKVTSNTSKNIKALLGYIPHKDDIVIYSSQSIGPELRDIKILLEREKKGIEKDRNVIMVTKDGLFSIPVEFFTSTPLENINSLHESDIENYILVENITGTYLPKKYLEFNNAIELINEYDPTIIESLGGLEEIRTYISLSVESGSNPHIIPYGNFRALIGTIYIHLNKTGDGSLFVDPIAIKRRVMDVKTGIREGLHPDFISPLPKIKKGQGMLFITRYKDIKILSENEVNTLLLGYELQKGEIIMDPDGINSSGLREKANDIFKLYPQVTAVLCNFNNYILRFTPDVQKEGDPFKYKII